METSASPQEKSARIINDNLYLTLATSSASGEPWATPLLYALHSGGICFMSDARSLHVRNILENAGVAFAVFDSHSRLGENDEVQASGRASVVEEPGELEQCIAAYSNRVFPGSSLPPSKRYDQSDFVGEGSKRFVLIKPDRVYVRWEGELVQVRL
jgi:nitroimidazol reductase NimA-like FMN-containing flavoprotein (pyridoxamine 5'-phosphate oxidase superfamily)